MRALALLIILIICHAHATLAQNESNAAWLQERFSGKGVSKNPDEAMRLLLDNKNSAREENDPQKEARAMMELAAFNSIQQKDYKAALDWLIQALKLVNKPDLQNERVMIFIAIARMFEEVGYLEKSIHQLDRATQTNKESDFELLLLILNDRGRIYAKLFQYDSAVQAYQKMLRFAHNSELRDWEGDALYALGELQTSTKEFDAALKNHRQGLDIRRALKDRSKEAASLNSIALLYLKEKNFERAKANFELAIKYRKQLNDIGTVAESYNNMGLLYIAQKDYKQAIAQFNLALKNAQEAGAPDQMLKANDNLSISYRALGDFKQALHYKDQLIGIHDMIQHEKDRHELVEIENRYAIEGRDAEISKLGADMKEREQKIAAQERERNFLLIVIGLVAVIGALILYLYFLIRRTNKRLTEINGTKDKLFSIIGHDLKAPLNSLMAFSSLLIHHSETLTKEEIKMLSGDVDKSLKNLFNLLENLLEWGRSQSGNVDFTPAPFDLAAVIQENFELLKPLAERKKIALVNMASGKFMVNAHRHSINTVVRNLTNNAIKFTSDGGQITLKAEEVNQQIKFTVADNGIGMSKETLKGIFKVGTKHSTLGTAQEKGTGLGLVICKDFIEKNGGSIGVESEQGRGSKFFFTVPMTK